MAYLICRDCKHVFVKDSLSNEEIIALYANRESHHGSKEKELWDYSDTKFKLFYKPILNKIGKLTEKSNLLDIGCSNGAFMNAAVKCGWDSYGIELEKKSYEVARRHGLTVYTRELHKEKFQDNFFQVITMWQVIEHLHNPYEMLKEIKRILKPGGILAISTPNIKSIAWLLLKERWNCVEPQVHLHLFQHSTLDQCAKNAGLQPKLTETLDLKPSTIKDFTAGFKAKKSNKRAASVANIANSSSKNKLKRLFLIRNMLNLPLKMFGLGEDIYGYYQKPHENK